MYSSLLDAPVNTELVMLQVTNPALEKWLQRMGLFTGGHIIRHDEDINFNSVRVHGDNGDVVIPAGMVMKLYIHLESGEKIPLNQMKKGQEGHVEIHSGGPFIEKGLARLGIPVEGNIRFIRSLPHMDYLVLINRRERTRLSEGEAARIWGNYPGKASTQFFFARKNLDFEVTEVMGGPRGVKHIETHGVTAGVKLTLESIDQTNSLQGHGPERAPVAISSPGGLRLFLTPEKAGAVIVRTA
ncbi:ferrous iron transport protein A [uncultured Desulfobacter sp.]|uniref:ferrous iron transport protein A n=1 Tax=uncultured Desulfobacter sp. TaxID=240139 RepID=UPI002AAA776A|nr:ferrous iron transport protein A [uncultured Desulfobacter sp.]